jgi:hypothetical protein
LEFQVENITRTVYGSFLQTIQLMGLPFTRKPNTTLNERFGVQADTLPLIDEMPHLRYFGIGNGGHQITQGADGIPKTEPIQHRATDASLFRPLPFVMRELNADITLAQRDKYGMRKVEVHNGVTYVVYYLRRIGLDNTVPAMEYKVVNAGVTTTTPFVPTTANLFPEPPTLPASGVGTVNGDYTTATAKVSLTLTAEDVTELLNVANILFADSGYAIVSEIALVSGVDKVVTSPGPNSTLINFKEVLAAQVVSFVNTFLPLNFANNGTEIILDAGATEPLFNVA